MIKIYVMNTCIDCSSIDEQVKGLNNYEVIDIGSHVKNLKAFLKLRDNNTAFDEIKKMGTIGIPCFILEDGTITFIPEEAGLSSQPATSGSACNIDGSGC